MFFVAVCLPRKVSQEKYDDGFLGRDVKLNSNVLCCVFWPAFGCSTTNSWLCCVGMRTYLPVLQVYMGWQPWLDKLSSGNLGKTNGLGKSQAHFIYFHVFSSFFSICDGKDGKTCLNAEQDEAPVHWSKCTTNDLFTGLVCYSDHQPWLALLRVYNNSTPTG